MKIFLQISYLIIPILILVIVIDGLRNKINIYDVFIEGVKEGMQLGIGIFPYLLGMIFAVNIFVDSGLINYIFSSISPFLETLKIPHEIIPMALIRPISGTSSLALLNNLLENFHPDSYIGRLASTIQGSTDTTFYVMTLYFGSVGIRNSKYAINVGLLADLIGIVSSIIVVYYLFY